MIELIQLKISFLELIICNITCRVLYELGNISEVFLTNFTSKTQIFLFEKIGVMRGNSSTNLVNKEVSVQAVLKSI